MQSDIRILELEVYRVKTVCRTPVKFGAVVVDELPLGFARAKVENREGQVAEGWGAMFLMDLWAWPVSEASHEQKSRAMCRLLHSYARFLTGYNQFAHPLEIFFDTEEELFNLRKEVCYDLTDGELMPPLAVLVCASPVDHALHDAFGKVNNIDSYLAYGRNFMNYDLSRYLGESLRGVYPSQFLRQDFVPELPVFHLVGGLDPLSESEVGKDALQDGLPNSLERWIERDGVFCLKIKLRGKDIDWDIERTIEVSTIYHEVREKLRPDLPEAPFLTADTNEQCETPEYIVEYLRRIREQDEQVYEELLYIEQPTERDLTLNRWDMRPISRLKPVLVDESLATVEDYRLAIELGWSGIALKSCKCLSSDLLFIAMAELDGIPYAVQDLSNPSLALLQSVGLAGRIHPVKGVEANSRQFFPSANELICPVHSEICRVRDGIVRTSSLQGKGLGFQIEKIEGLREFLEAGEKAFQKET